MHSWSLSKQQPDGPTQTYDVLQPEAPDRLDGFLESLKGFATVVTAKDLAAAQQAGKLRLHRSIDIGAVKVGANDLASAEDKRDVLQARPGDGLQRLASNGDPV